MHRNQPGPSQGISLPNSVMQNQIYELSKTLPNPNIARKQNTACDACRSRKVKCNKLPNEDKCQHCIAKNLPCTHLMMQATSEKKKIAPPPRRQRNTSTTNAQSHHASNSPSPMPSPSAVPLRLITPDLTANPPYPQYSPVTPVRQGNSSVYDSELNVNSPTSVVLAWMFAPPRNELGFSAYAEWGDVAFRLEDETYRAEFALDLVEVFFQIVHTRIPMLNPASFRARFHLHTSLHSGPSSNTHLVPLNPALVATVVAWGAKFSEHPLLNADRGRRADQQSVVAKTLVHRARDLAEMLKVNRIATADNVAIALLIEPLQSQTPDDPDGYHGFWLTAAIRNLLALKINKKSVTSNIEDPESRGTMTFAWWMAVLSDSYHAIYYGKKPLLDLTDYDIDQFSDPVSQEAAAATLGSVSPREQLEFLGFYTAAHSMACIARDMAREFCKPTTDAEGLHLSVVKGFSKALMTWKDAYLTKVGVPNDIHGSWDFMSAVTACAGDATYHLMWIFLFNALDDIGVWETNETTRTGNPPYSAPEFAEVEQIKKQVMEQAINGALRIAALAGVLTENFYMRLDPAVMHVSCNQAGTLLARIGRPEVATCIAALEQYSVAYEEAALQAAEIKQIFGQSSMGEVEFSHMASVMSVSRQNEARKRESEDLMNF